MNNENFLKWIYNRLVHVYKVNPGYDFMLRLKTVKDDEKYFLSGIYDRLINVHKVNPGYDFMMKFQKIIENPTN